MAIAGNKLLSLSGAKVLYDDLRARIEGALAAGETSPAAAAHAVGDVIVVDGVLYKVTAAIAVGDTITATGAGANVTAATVAELIAAAVGGIDLTDLIDDTAGDGTTNKTWSADKLAELAAEVGVPVCLCETNASTQVKQITYNGELRDGTLLFVHFVYQNSADSPQLQINEGETLYSLQTDGTNAAAMNGRLNGYCLLMYRQSAQRFYVLWSEAKSFVSYTDAKIGNSLSMGRNDSSTVGDTTIGEHSTALGYRAIASGENSFASGSYAKASGPNSSAFGNNAKAQGKDSFAFGDLNTDNPEIDTWASNTLYKKGKIIKVHVTQSTYHINSDFVMRCLVDHTSGSSFYSDWRASPPKWKELCSVSGSGNLTTEKIKRKYAEMVGGGYGSDNEIINLRTLDWGGNETLEGDLTAKGGQITIGSTTLTEANLQALLALLNT